MIALHSDLFAAPNIPRAIAVNKELHPTTATMLTRRLKRQASIQSSLWIAFWEVVVKRKPEMSRRRDWHNHRDWLSAGINLVHCLWPNTLGRCLVWDRARILVQVTIYRRLLIGRDGHLDQSEAYDMTISMAIFCVAMSCPRKQIQDAEIM